MIEIKRLTEDDANYFGAVNRLLKQLSEKAPEISKSDLRYAAMQTHTYLFLAIDTEKSGDDSVVGMALIFFSWRPEGWLGEIHSVVVDSAYRGRGIGNMLTQELLKTAQDRAKEMKRPIALYLTSNPKREAANKMYQKHGFELVAAAIGHGTNLYKLVIAP